MSPNPRFELTPPDPYMEFATASMNSVNETAARSAILSRVVALLRPATHGSSARRSVANEIANRGQHEQDALEPS